MRRIVMLGLAAAALTLCACSQVSALAPVSGSTVTSLTTAAADVLLQKNVAILVAPACAESPTTKGDYTCSGRTLDGAEVSVTASGTPVQMTVTVGGTVLYQGDMDSIIQQFAQVAP